LKTGLVYSGCGFESYLYRFKIWSCGPMATMPACRAEDEGSIPFTTAKKVFE
jgi:hypothetical protein